MKKLGFLIIALLFFNMFYGQSDKRLALIIGNADYENSGSLKNPVNDAKLMYQTLEDLGFDVTLLTNAGLKEMQKAAIDFTNKVEDYAVALFYYAGHGVQLNGVNFLVPVDAKLENELSAKYEAFDISDINYAFSRNNENLNIMILDACRDNPFRSWMRGGNNGFAAPGNQAAGTIIAFATREGETASDGFGDNGLFTEKLVQQLKIPQNITEVFQNTRVEVLEASDNIQCPQEWNMLTGNFSLAEQENIIINAETEEETTGGLVIGKVEKNYGNIVIDTEIGGKLFLDGKLMGSLPSNSKGNQLTKTLTGNHKIRLEGNNGKVYTENIYLEKDQNYSIVFKDNKKDDVVVDNRQNKNYNSATGFTDRRDGQTYKKVKIGNQSWMAENLAYKAPEGAWSYLDNTENVPKYGYLYNFEIAQDVCPDGWHIPSKNEWLELKRWLEENASPDKSRRAVKNEPAKPLKSTEEWLGENGNGIDEFGFTSLPTGYRRANGTYKGIGSVSIWWTSTEDKKDKAIFVEIRTSHSFETADHFREYGFAVRCLEDN